MQLINCKTCILAGTLVTLTLTGLAIPAPALAASDPAARVIYAKGVSSVRAADGTTRLLGNGAPVHVQDTITTGNRSFVLIEFRDGTRITVRPGSEFMVDTYRHEETANEAVFRLLKGGLRALTGLISKLNPDGYQVVTPIATMGIRGTEFDARLCEQDCAEENRRYSSNGSVTATKVIGRVAQKQGALTARDITGRDRRLAVGGPVYEGDTLLTGSDAWSVIAFRDDTRVTLQPETEFVIQDYAYNPDARANNGALFNLLRGGLRTLTGAIARINQPAFSVRTPTATMGVRGTGFDSFHRNPTWANVWSGEIHIETPGGTLIVKPDQTVHVATAGAPPQLLPGLPAFLQGLPGPRPDQVDLDIEKLFGTRDPGEIKPGLWVFVRDGHVRLDGQLDLGAGDAAFADLNGASRLQIIPVFFLEDVIPLPGSTGIGGPMSCEVR